MVWAYSEDAEGCDVYDMDITCVGWKQQVTKNMLKASLRCEGLFDGVATVCCGFFVNGRKTVTVISQSIASIARCCESQ